MTLVSIIITSFNRENFIEETIKSALNISFDDYEIIIVDDCSTDNTYSIIKKFEYHNKIKIYRNSKNLGQFENRNYAVSKANGKYIKYLDSDDLIYKHCLSVMVDAMTTNPEAVLAISHNKIDDILPYPIIMTPEESFKASFLASGFPFSGPSASIILKEAFIKIGGFHKPYYVGSDSILWLKLASKYPIIKLPPSLIWYRQHEGQAYYQGMHSNEYLEFDFKNCFQLLKDKDCPLSNFDKNLAIKKLEKRFLRNLFNLIIKEKKLFKSLSIFNHSGLNFFDLRKIL